MLEKAIDTLQSDENPTVHSDRGCHYRWPGWIQRMDEAGLKKAVLATMLLVKAFLED